MARQQPADNLGDFGRSRDPFGRYGSKQGMTSVGTKGNAFVVCRIDHPCHRWRQSCTPATISSASIWGRADGLVCLRLSTLTLVTASRPQPLAVPILRTFQIGTADLDVDQGTPAAAGYLPTAKTKQAPQFSYATGAAHCCAVAYAGREIAVQTPPQGIRHMVGGSDRHITEIWPPA